MNTHPPIDQNEPVVVATHNDLPKMGIPDTVYHVTDTQLAYTWVPGDLGGYYVWTGHVGVNEANSTIRSLLGPHNDDELSVEQLVSALCSKVDGVTRQAAHLEQTNTVLTRQVEVLTLELEETRRLKDQWRRFAHGREQVIVDLKITNAKLVSTFKALRGAGTVHPDNLR